MEPALSPVVNELPKAKKELSPLLLTLVLVAASILFAVFLFLAVSIQSFFASQPKTSFVVPKTTTSPTNSGDEQRKTDLQVLKKALLAYKASQGSFPNSLADLVPDYLASIPVDPETSTGYNYIAGLDKNSFTLKASLSSGEIYTLDQN